MLTRAQGPGVYYLHTEAEQTFWRMASAKGTFSARGMQGKYEELGSDPWHTGHGWTPGLGKKPEDLWGSIPSQHSPSENSKFREILSQRIRWRVTGGDTGFHKHLHIPYAQEPVHHAPDLPDEATNGLVQDPRLPRIFIPEFSAGPSPISY